MNTNNSLKLNLISNERISKLNELMATTRFLRDSIENLYIKIHCEIQRPVGWNPNNIGEVQALGFKIDLLCAEICTFTYVVNLLESEYEPHL